jgi:hypothetical protein
MSGIDPSVLLGFYQAQRFASPSAIAAGNRNAAALRASQSKPQEPAPWDIPNKNDAKQDAKVLSTTNFLDTSKVPLSAGATEDSRTAQDNQKLFALYSAVNTLAYITKMAQKSTATSGQLAGLNARFQTGLEQVKKYLSSTEFNNFTLQAAKPSDQVVSEAAVKFSDYTYKTKQLIGNSQLTNPLPGLSASDSFTIAVKKAGVTTNVVIDLSQVSGGLTLGNVISYVNSQLSAGGFTTRFQKTTQGETATSAKNATYGLQVTPGANETISFSASSAPALYMVGNSGSATETNTVTNAATSAATTSEANQAGRLNKLSGIDGSPSGVFSVNQQDTSGITSAQRTVVDASGNIYVIGTATGNFDKQLNQATQDVYLTKYDSAGRQTWSKLLGSAGTASGYGLALDPSGGVVITGASTADLTTSSVADGNNDSFVARYTANGDQSWIKQIPTLANNQANAISIDAAGNITIGGSVSGGVIGAGMTASGKADAFLAKFDSKGKLLAENQFGTSGNDSVAATATAADGSLYVASVQNGRAILSKYTGGDITAAPAWSQDLGDLMGGGAIGGLAVDGNQVYLSGTTSNSNLTAGGAAAIVTASSGGTEAFVFALTDNGGSASADRISYVGTGTGDKGGAVTVGPDGTVYLAGTTSGTFAGQARNVQNTDNAFATALNGDGTVKWTRQFGGQDGKSTGAGLAIDPNGSSVLDALGLPRGTLNLDQSVELTSQTTLRAGSSFQIKILGNAARTATITIDQGETLDSLATKINAQLGGLGKASVNYLGGSANLKLKVNPGTTLDLVSGPKDFDALARLGIAAGILTAPAKKGDKVEESDATTFGLGFSGTLDISTRTGANFARTQLLAVLSSLQSTYQKTNAPPAQATIGNTTGKASPHEAALVGKYTNALGLLGS